MPLIIVNEVFSDASEGLQTNENNDDRGRDQPTITIHLFPTKTLILSEYGILAYVRSLAAASSEAVRSSTDFQNCLARIWSPAPWNNNPCFILSSRFLDLDCEHPMQQVCR